MKTTDYVAAVGEQDKERLSIQHQTFSAGTYKFLNEIGIKVGMKILIVGCGAGDETVMISKLVGESGQVIAIDISQEQIHVAKNRMTNEKINNVKFEVLDANNLERVNDEFDIAYCRMLLVHVPNPIDILNKMLGRLKINGKLACEEPDISTCFTIPQSEAFNKHISLLCEFIRKKGCDPDLGKKTYGMFKDIGCTNITISFFQPAVTDSQQKIAALLSAKNCGPQYITSGLANQNEVDEIISGIEKEVVNDDEVVMAQVRMAQVSGIK